LKIAVSYPVAESLVSPGFEVEVVAPITIGIFGPAMTAVDDKIQELAYLDATLRAHAGGADAYFQNTGGDYGVLECRSVVPIPVIGGGQLSMFTASTIGKRFAVVTVWPAATNAIHERQLVEYGMKEHCVSIRNVLARKELGTVDDHLQVRQDLDNGEPTIIDRIVNEIKRAVDEDAADAVVLGCTCMSTAVPLIAPRVDVPVVDPMRVGYKFTEALLTAGLGRLPVGPMPTLVSMGRLQPMLATAIDVGEMADGTCGDACDALESMELDQLKVL
jgi:Asp/Glu/hydantoin racemase